MSLGQICYQVYILIALFFDINLYKLNLTIKQLEGFFQFKILSCLASTNLTIYKNIQK